MRRFSYAAVAAGLFCCLAAPPARADVATPEAGAADVSSGELLAALEALAVMTDAVSTLPETSTFASETKSTGPTSAPYTSQGLDSSNGSMDTGSISTAGFGNTESSTTTANGEAFQAAAPSGLQGEGGHLVGSAPAASLDLSSLATSASSPQIVGTEDITNPDSDPDPPAVPIPPTVLLLGAGLLGIYPLRRSSRFSLGV